MVEARLCSKELGLPSSDSSTSPISLMTHHANPGAPSAHPRAEIASNAPNKAKIAKFVHAHKLIIVAS